jgi:hypothetical protein
MGGLESHMGMLERRHNSNGKVRVDKEKSEWTENSVLSLLTLILLTRYVQYVKS